MNPNVSLHEVKINRVLVMCLLPQGQCSEVHPVCLFKPKLGCRYLYFTTELAIVCFLSKNSVASSHHCILMTSDELVWGRFGAMPTATRGSAQGSFLGAGNQTWPSYMQDKSLPHCSRIPANLCLILKDRTVIFRFSKLLLQLC